MLSNGGVALRVDDVGAASKKHEVYGNTSFNFGNLKIPFPGNFLFFKYLKPFKRWGPYPELSAEQLDFIFEYCRSHQIKLTIGITAGWVERDGSVIDFPEKYPQLAACLKSTVKNNLVEIANHGYTHCVLENRAFLPRWFQSNRQWHREFWSWIPAEIQERHLALSQKILETYFETKIVTFVPPGNVFGDQTLTIAKRYGLRYVSCHGVDQKRINDLIPIPESQVIAFHDKELIEYGTSWFKTIEEQLDSKSFLFIREIGEALESTMSHP